MPRALESRAFSSQTLLAGLDLVETGRGMSSLADIPTAELEAELAKVQVGWLGGAISLL